MIVVETQRLLVRYWVPDDWKRLLPLMTDPRVLRYIGDGQPWPEERVRRFVDGGIEKARTRGWVLWPVIHRDDGELIGFCGFNDGFAPEVEIGWRLRPDYWGRGLATEAARAVMDYGFRTFDFPRLIAVVQPANIASIRVMEKLGMTFDAQFIHNGVPVVRYAKPNPHAGGCFRVCEIGAEDGTRLKEVRLKALADAPYAFGGTETLEQERALPDTHWHTLAAELAGLVPEWRGRCVGFFIFHGQDVIATAGVYLCSRVAGRAYFSAAWVDPHYRRRGLGRSLVRLSLDWARERRAQHVRLWVDDTNPAAAALYRSLGFHPTGERRLVGPQSKLFEGSMELRLMPDI